MQKNHTQGQITQEWKSQDEMRAEEQTAQRSSRHVHQVIPLNKLFSSSTAHSNATLLLEQRPLEDVQFMSSGHCSQITSHSEKQGTASAASCSGSLPVEDDQLFSLLPRYTSNDKAFPYGLKCFIYCVIYTVCSQRP